MPRTNSYLTAAAIVCGLAFCFAAQTLAQESWPQWRGPRLDSVVEGDVGVVSTLDKSTMLWRTELPGPAGSSPVVASDRVFLTSISGEDLVVICVSVATGETLWTSQGEGKNKNSRDRGNSASSSPCTDGEHVWTMFGNGQINCFTVDGEAVWSKNLQQEYGTFNIQFGMSTTPVLHDGHLVYALMHGNMRDRKSTSIGTIVSLDAKTGKENWKQLRKTDAIAENKHVYSSPTIASHDGKDMLIVHGADYTTGHSLRDGRELWRIGGMNPKGSNYNPFLRFVSSAVAKDGKVVIPSAKRGPVWAMSVDGGGKLTKEDLEWVSPRVTPDVSTPVIYKDFVFLSRENGALACLNASTGKKLVEKRYMADRQRSTPVAVDGKLIITDRSGKVILVKADESLAEIASIELGEETLSSPAVAGGVIFVRTFEALYAFGSKSPVSANFAIAIHGGAGSSKDSMNEEAVAVREKAMKEALTIGKEILANGGTSMEAVQSVIVFLENDPHFNAGKGAVLNAEGKHELDASIMNGENRQCGAVAGVSTIKNPIIAAKRVMTDTRHVLLAAAGAEAFADSLGSQIERVPNEYFTTPRRAKQLEKMKRRKAATKNSNTQSELWKAKADRMGTVGCVALDSHGNLAAGTSTGGMSNKKFGRVGDSPIVGAGTYADNKTCAVSGTGVGEQYIRNAVAYNVAAQMQYGNVTLKEALSDNLENRLDRNDGGLIAVDHKGNIETGTNTPGMLRGIADGKGRFEVSW